VRTINVTTIQRIAEGDTSGHEWKFVSTAGYSFDLGGMKLRPFIGIDYTTGKLDGFTEVGAGALNLTVDNISADRADMMLGLDLRANPNAQISPYGQLTWRHNLDSQHDRVTAVFNGDPASLFSVSAVTPRNDQIDVDAGVNFQANPNLAIFAGYQGPSGRISTVTASRPA
jgi:outer membrane autotransporter protein